MARPKHPNKKIEAAIKYAEEKGWRYKESGNSAHSWGRLYCPFEDREGHMMSIWSTPKNADVHAMQIKRKVDACEHGRYKDE